MQDRVSGRRIKLQSRLWNTSTLSTQTGKLLRNKSDRNQLVSTNGVHIQDIRQKWCQRSSRERRILFQVCNIRGHYVGVRYSDHVDRAELMICFFSIIPFSSLAMFISFPCSKYSLPSFSLFVSFPS